MDLSDLVSSRNAPSSSKWFRTESTELWILHVSATLSIIWWIQTTYAKLNSLITFKFNCFSLLSFLHLKWSVYFHVLKINSRIKSQTFPVVFTQKQRTDWMVITDKTYWRFHAIHQCRTVSVCAMSSQWIQPTVCIVLCKADGSHWMTMGKKFSKT